MSDRSDASANSSSTSPSSLTAAPTTATGAPLTVRGEERRRALLRHATDVFFESGYEGASIGEIIKRSGGSRSFIYQCWQGKEGLFLACLQQIVDDLYQDYVAEGRRSGALRDELAVFGRIFLTHMTHPRTVKAVRLILAETPRFPAIGDWYWREGVEKSYACFARILDDYLVAEPEELLEISRTYIELLKSGLPQRALAYPGLEAAPEQIDEETARAADWLAHAVEGRFAPRQPPRKGTPSASSEAESQALKAGRKASASRRP